jgi:hypothetical protein
MIRGRIFRYSKEAMENDDFTGIQYLRTRRLDAVIFVQDYVQLVFKGARFTAFLCPTVRNTDDKFDPSTAGYRDALCNQINKVVIDAYKIQGEKLVLEFDDRSVLEVSLKPENQIGPEAAMLSDAKGRLSVWRAGED